MPQNIGEWKCVFAICGAEDIRVKKEEEQEFQKLGEHDEWQNNILSKDSPMIINNYSQIQNMIKNYHLHKRNTSQSFKVEPKIKIITDKNPKRKTNNKNKSKTLSLIEKSNKKIPYKQTLVEDLDQNIQPPSSPFFAFGKKESAPKNWELGIHKITQVQDSKRQVTSHRSHRDHYMSTGDKENYDLSNFDEKLRKSAKSQNKSNKSSKSKHKKSKNEKTRSTISLSRVKYGNKEMEARTQKIQKSMKMLWECMGQLWQSSRVSQYKSQKNGQNLNALKRKMEEHEQKILQIKFQIGRSEHRGGLRA